MDQNIMILWIVAWLSALGFAFWRLRWVESQSQGTDEIAKIAGHIRSGAMAFLNREYRVLAVFVLIVAILLMIQAFQLVMRLEPFSLGVHLRGAP